MIYTYRANGNICIYVNKQLGNIANREYPYLYIYIYIYIYPHGFANPRHSLSRTGSTTWQPTSGVLPPIGLPK